MATESVTLPAEKPVMLVAIDNSEHSFYALEWTLDHFFVPHAPNFPFNLIVVHAKPSPTTSIGYAGPGGVEILPFVDSDLKKIAERVVDKANELCISKSVSNVVVEVWEGDARNVLCESVEKHHTSILVLGNHGFGAIKRAVLGSVSDYCAHHAHCSVCRDLDALSGIAGNDFLTSKRRICCINQLDKELKEIIPLDACSIGEKESLT